MTRFTRFKAGDRESYGLVTDEGICDLSGSEFATLEARLAAGLPPAGATRIDHQLSAVHFLPPIANPTHIWCLALNYVEHHTEVEAAGRVQELPKQPALFARAHDSLTGHDQPLLHPGVSEQFDFEGELAVVIGIGGYRIKAEDAFDHVGGYTIMNEGSVRDWQFHTRQITPGKNFYRSGSIGPWIVPAREIADVNALRIRTTLAGTLMQDDRVGSMVHKIPRFIEYASTIAPLYPGDILATGTPSGVGFSRKPPVFMKVGDVCEVSIDGIGTLRNRVEANP